MVNNIIPLLEEAARAGGDVLRKYFKETNLEISEKTNQHDIVTLADKEAQKVIIDILKLKSVDCGLDTFGIIGEEGVDIAGEYRFVIDPLDGTNNFAGQFEYFCVSIGLLKGSEPIAGVVYDVMKDVVYSAEKGKGAYKNGKKLVFRGDIPLEQSVVVATLSSRPDMRNKGLEFLGAFFPLVRTIRLFGAVALDLCRMADGAGNILTNFSCKIWDIAAAVLIFRESGGVVVTPNGSPLVMDPENAMYKYSLIASDAVHIEKVVEVYNEIGLKLHGETAK